MHAMLNNEVSSMSDLLSETHELIIKKEKKFGNFTEKKFQQIE